MTKKVGLLSLVIFGILFVGVTFANPIALDIEDFPDVCYKIKNVEIDDYRVVIEYGKRKSDGSSPYDLLLIPNYGKREIYEPRANECTKCSDWGSSKVYLLNNNIDTKDITQENIDDIAMFIGNISNSDCVSNYDKIETYKITKNGDNYEIVLKKTREIKDIKKFLFFWLGTIIIETLLLFFMVKIFRKDSQISNKKLILFGILPTTITLPLLWFLLPLLIGDGIRYIIIGETLVTAIEAIIIKYGLNISWKRSIIASVICNLFSFLLLSFKNGEGIWNLDIRLFLLGFLILPIILLIMGKGLRKRDDIPNKKFVITGIVALIVAILLIMLLWFTLGMYMENRLILLILGMLIFTLTFVIEIKFGLGVSWKEAILMAVACDLSIFILVFVFYLVIYGFYE